MKKYEKEILQDSLNNEEAVLKKLQKEYRQSVKDINKVVSELNTDIKYLQSIYDAIGDDGLGEVAQAYFAGKGKKRLKWATDNPEEAKATLQSMIRSKVYQKKYQNALKKQVNGILNTMKDNQFKTISEYLEKCYEEGFTAAMYALHKQGIPLIFPLDQNAMVKAVQIDSKISEGLYTKLGEDVDELKKKITSEVSRGISTGRNYKQVAQQLAAITTIGYNKAVRIARTEGNRINNQSAMDAAQKAKDKGCDVMKQWNAALDSRTRRSHAMCDGEIRELDEKFSNGLMMPSDPDGKASEVINCRCRMFQIGKWELDEEELNRLKERAAFYGLDKTSELDDFKKKYLKAAEAESQMATKEIKNAIDFGYGGYTQEDYNKWVNQYDKINSGVHLKDSELKIIEDYTEGGYIGFNGVSRGMEESLLKKGYKAEDIEKLRKKADVLEDVLSRYKLDTDIVTHRFERDVSWLTGKGNDIEDLKNIVGKEYTAKGFTSSGVLPNRFRFTGGKADAVHFEIVTPKGTNGAFLSMSKKGEHEFLYNRNTRFKILDGGERVVKEQKFNIKTMKMEEVEIKERFLKVQAIIDNQLEKSVKQNTIKLDINNFPKAFTSKSEKKNTQTFIDYVNALPDADGNHLKLYNSMGKMESIEAHGIPFKISHKKNHAVSYSSSYYSGNLLEVELAIPKLSGDNLAGQIQTILHENMHLIDMYLRKDAVKGGDWFSDNRPHLVDMFKTASTDMSEDIQNLFKQFKIEYDATRDSVYNEYKAKNKALRESYFPEGTSIFSDFSKYKQYEKERKKFDKWYETERDYQCRNIMGGGMGNLQDIYDALSGGSLRDNGTVKYGHGSSYYRNHDKRVEETLANYAALSVGRPDLIELLKADKPDLVAELEETVKEMLKKVGE